MVRIVYSFSLMGSGIVFVLSFLESSDLFLLTLGVYFICGAVLFSTQLSSLSLFPFAISSVEQQSASYNSSLSPYSEQRLARVPRP